MRILMQSALQPEMLLSIPQVAEAHAISRNHVMKVVSRLAQAGLLTTVRGRSGGFRLGKPAEAITLGDIARITEPTLQPAECGTCVLSPNCGLTQMLNEAVIAFLTALDSHTLADAASRTVATRLLATRQEEHVSQDGKDD